MKGPIAYALGCFTLSLSLTALGFFLEPIPFALAYIPLALAICNSTSLYRFWLVCGHFFWVATISAWGLYQLGYNPVLTALAAASILGIGSWLMSNIGIGLSAALLCLIPFFPANPLLVTGAILPGYGEWGVGLLLVMIIGVETLSAPKARAAILTTVVFMGQMPFSAFFGESDKTQDSTQKHRVLLAAPAQAIPIASTKYTEIDTASISAVTRLGRWTQIANRIEPGAFIVFGENVFGHTDIGARSYWCRIAQNTSATLFIGVSGAHNVGEVWRFEGSECPHPAVVYRAVVGIPMLTGNWWPEYTKTIPSNVSRSEIQWLVCFEAFSLTRWQQVGRLGRVASDRLPSKWNTQHQQTLEAVHPAFLSEFDKTRYTLNQKDVIIISNDAPTRPFPTGVLRRKVSHQFAKLFDLRVAHANTGENVIHVIP